MNVADLIIKHLEDIGTEYIFGIPGGALEPLTTALKNSKIKAIVTKHEGGAAFMADGYARVSGKIGVCCATTGPGSTNLVTGVASAHADSIPLLALTALPPTTISSKGAFQEFVKGCSTTADIFRNITKYSAMITNEQKAETIIIKALKIALSDRKGPVHLSLPSDIMRLEVKNRGKVWVLQNNEILPDREAVKKAVRVLIEAKKPVIFAGWGTVLSKADNELKELVGLLGIPLASSQKGKGILNEKHSLALGVFGFAGSQTAKEYITKERVDVMLAVGTSFNEWLTCGWDERLSPTKIMIQVDIDKREIGKNYKVDIGILGDAKSVLSEILRELKIELRKKKNNTFPLNPEIPSFIESVKKNLIAGNGSCDPRQLILDITGNLPEETIYFADIGNSMAWALKHAVITKPYSFYVPLGFASMGHAVAGSIGAKLATPNRPVVAIVGDGAFLMNGMEAATAINYDIPVIWVILNNAMLGMIYHGRKMANLPDVFSSGFKQVDFVKIMEGLGGTGFRITKNSEITDKFMREILSLKKPVVLDVIIDAEAVPPIHARLETFEKFYS